ncbi:hypothetical protein HGRIS_003314 [Hohenbuehelia grisea]|uniref:Uncharacterized protein n=1 Tax=Hohenbuehelia grisea TaxID=104357 RepID=A0ABR3JF26_9AGAR
MKKSLTKKEREQMVRDRGRLAAGRTAIIPLTTMQDFSMGALLRTAQTKKGHSRNNHRFHLPIPFGLSTALLQVVNPTTQLPQHRLQPPPCHGVKVTDHPHRAVLRYASGRPLWPICQNAAMEVEEDGKEEDSDGHVGSPLGLITHRGSMSSMDDCTEDETDKELAEHPLQGTIVRVLSIIALGRHPYSRPSSSTSTSTSTSSTSSSTSSTSKSNACVSSAAVIS